MAKMSEKTKAENLAFKLMDEFTAAYDRTIDTRNLVNSVEYRDACKALAGARKAIKEAIISK